MTGNNWQFYETRCTLTIFLANLFANLSVSFLASHFLSKFCGRCYRAWLRQGSLRHRFMPIGALNKKHNPLGYLKRDPKGLSEC